jgi:hypothetical protein
MSSIILYHGPEAFEIAKAAARKAGRMVSKPLGEGGLKVDEARYVVSLMMRASLGDRSDVVVVGPLDRANEKASDTLLKVVEEPPAGALPFFWADDLSGVAATLRSRCQPQWCPGEGSPLPEEVQELAWHLCDDLRSGDIVAVSQALEGYKKKKGDLEDLIRGLVQCIVHSAKEGDLEVLDLWEGIRPELCHDRPIFWGVLRGLLGVSHG